MEFREKFERVKIYKGKFICPRCGSWEMLFSKNDVPNNFCGRCGQRLDWFDENNKPIYNSSNVMAM